jgi:hypothetical protein
MIRSWDPPSCRRCPPSRVGVGMAAGFPTRVACVLAALSLNTTQCVRPVGLNEPGYVLDFDVLLDHPHTQIAVGLQQFVIMDAGSGRDQGT